MSLKLHEGAILISDAHYSQKHPEFLAFLKDVATKKIQTTQLVFLGDMFELLFGVISKTQEENAQAIELIETISQTTEIIYFEGNHDFGLKKVFPSLTIFPLQQQPQSFDFITQKVLISHGDTRTPLGYRIYTKLIRNPLILFMIGLIDRTCSYCIINWLKSRGERKDPCYKISLFNDIIKKRLSYLRGQGVDVVIEGHFHQNRAFVIEGFEYINLSAFACNRTYFIVQSSKGQLSLKPVEFPAC